LLQVVLNQWFAILQGDAPGSFWQIKGGTPPGGAKTLALPCIGLPIFWEIVRVEFLVFSWEWEAEAIGSKK
jgi:hypothetical protein